MLVQNTPKTMWRSDRRIYLDKDGKVVESYNPDREKLLVAEGGEIPLERARELGLVEGETEETDVAVPDIERSPEPLALAHLDALKSLYGSIRTRFGLSEDPDALLTDQIETGIALWTSPEYVADKAGKDLVEKGEREKAQTDLKRVQAALTKAENERDAAKRDLTKAIAERERLATELAEARKPKQDPPTLGTEG